VRMLVRTITLLQGRVLLAQNVFLCYTTHLNT